MTAAWTHESCNRSGWVGPGEPCPICEDEARRCTCLTTGPETCPLPSPAEVEGILRQDDGANDLLRTQLQETGSIPTGGGFDLPWLLLLLSDLGIDENAVYIDVIDGRIEVKK